MSYHVRSGPIPGTRTTGTCHAGRIGVDGVWTGSTQNVAVRNGNGLRPDVRRSTWHGPTRQTGIRPTGHAPSSARHGQHPNRPGTGRNDVMGDGIPNDRPDGLVRPNGRVWFPPVDNIVCQPRSRPYAHEPLPTLHCKTTSYSAGMIWADLPRRNRRSGWCGNGLHWPPFPPRNLVALNLVALGRKRLVNLVALKSGPRTHWKCVFALICGWCEFG